MTRLWMICLLAFAATAFTGCFTEDDDSEPDASVSDGGGDGGTDGGGDCTSGDVQTCTCPGQADGLQACRADGTWGQCACAADCPSGQHDGGDGTCVAQGTCSSGYHDGGEGTCVPAGACLTGYHDGGDGSCVAVGLCQVGYHDGGDGECAPEGTCSVGYRPGTTGTCIPLQSCIAGLQVTPTQLQFGDLPVGQTETRFVTIANPALFDPCTITSAGLASGTDADYVLEGGPLANLTLDPGEGITLGVEFAPTDAGAASGFLTAIDELGGVHTVRLLGNGLDVAASVSPTGHDFGSIAYPCGTGTSQLCVNNDGGIELAITSAGTSGGPFTLSGVPPTPILVPVGGSVCFGVVYVPSQVGPESGMALIDVAPGGFSFVVPLSGVGAAQGTATETFLQTAAAKADILWVIDDSCSMNEEQTSLATNAPQLITYLDQQGVDYQMAVVSTDDTTAGVPPNIPGMMEPQARNRPHIVTPATPNPAATFAQNVQLGTNGSPNEVGMQVARLALTAPMITDPAQNGGFIRPDAYLSVIFVSDEPDFSTDTVDNYQAFYEGIHGSGRPDLFIASAFVGPPPTPTNPTGGCNGNGMSAQAAPRYWDIAGRTGGAQEALCSGNWTAAMQAIAAGFGLVSRFPLSGTADASGTMSVWIIDAGGARTPATGWSYDAGANAIDFTAASVPQPGETVEVTYTTVCQ
ncbi:MAG: choice-of-anchor D domain-containing protein [Deltaproteobacteria bacterium]|nr:choice-of-anchor D domain-containing protein [Deltaproteobacteria bacterium]